MSKTIYCPLCGSMVCGCQYCFNEFDISIQFRYGICDTCIEGVMKRVGETSISTGDSRIIFGQVSETDQYRIEVFLNELTNRPGRF